MTTERASKTKPNGAYADVNGINLYYEIHGAGRPLVLLHGGLGSGEMFGPALPALAAGHQVILPDLQGHGRTADIDRPIDVQLMADDIAALITHLGLEKPDVVGYSLGGGVAFFTAVKHPEQVRRMVMVSTNMRRSAIYPEMLAQQGQVGPEAAEFMKDTPMYKLYQRVAPRPGGLRPAARQDRRVDGQGLRLLSDEVRGADRCRPCSRAPTPTCSRPATRSRSSSCSAAASATAAGWARAGPRRSCSGDHARRDPLRRLPSPVLTAAILAFLDAPAA